MSEYYDNVEDIMALTGLSADEVREQTVAAWLGSNDYTKRCAVAQGGGPREWVALMRDDSAVVRMVVAKSASADYQIQMINDDEPAVLDYLAKYGTNAVRCAMIDQGITDQAVMKTTMLYGSVAVRKRLVAALWNRPTDLKVVIPYAVASDLEALMSHPDMDVVAAAASHGTREMANRALNMPGIGMRRFEIEMHLEALDDASIALGLISPADLDREEDGFEEDPPEDDLEI